MGRHAPNTPAELVDLYRTLVALALPDPASGTALIQPGVDGVDLSGVLDGPTRSVREYAPSPHPVHSLHGGIDI